MPSPTPKHLKLKECIYPTPSAARPPAITHPAHRGKRAFVEARARPADAAIEPVRNRVFHHFVGHFVAPLVKNGRNSTKRCDKVTDKVPKRILGQALDRAKPETANDGSMPRSGRLGLRF